VKFGIPLNFNYKLTIFSPMRFVLTPSTPPVRNLNFFLRLDIAVVVEELFLMFDDSI